MKKMKKVIILVLVLIVILILIILGWILSRKKISEETVPKEENGEDVNFSISDEEQKDDQKKLTTLHDIDNMIDYELAVTCTNTYFNSINQSAWDLSNDQNNEVKNACVQRVYNLLSKEYIEKNKITTENVMDYVDKINGITFFIPLKIKTISAEDESTQKFSVYGIEEDENYSYIKDFYLVITTNTSQNEESGYTIAIEPQINVNYQSIDDIKIENSSVNITQNDDNVLYDVEISDEKVTRDFTDYYKKLILGRPDIAYDLLNKDYRDKRFGSLDKFKSFIEEDKQEMETLYMKQYQVNRSDGENENNSDITQYVGKDQYGRVYAFDMESPTNYTVQLDSYTLNTDYFKSQYDSGNSEKKVALDVYKFILMINNQDWDTAYSLLDDGFKNNYFKTVDDFKNYVRECAYKYNEMEPTSFEQVGNIYTYGVQLTDLTEGAYEDETKGTGGSGYIFDWKFNVQLGNDYDYKISFEVN